MMRVVHIIAHLDLGGSERVALNIAKSKEQGINYHIVEVARTSGEFRERIIQECVDNGITVHTSPVRRNKLAIILFPFFFLPVMLKVRPTIIHTHTEIPDLSIFIWHFLFGWIFPEVKYVRTIHNTELWNEWKSIGTKVEPFFIKENANIAIGESVQLCYQTAYGQKPDIIHNGVGEVEQKRFNDIIEGKINILFAGRLEHQKGIDQLVQVVNAFKDDGRFVFHIVGNGSMKSKVECLMNLPSVRIYDKIYGLSSYLASFDFLFMPSNFEGLALMSIEASLAKLPTIINNSKGLKETLPDNWALSVNDNNVDDFIRIFRDIEIYDRKTLGNKAYLFAKEHYGIGEMQTAYEKFYNS